RQHTNFSRDWSSEVYSSDLRIVDLVKIKIASTDSMLGGPFRSMEEFLSPSPLFAGLDTEGNPGGARSLLEAAIADAGINEGIEKIGRASCSDKRYICDVVTR